MSNVVPLHNEWMEIYPGKVDDKGDQRWFVFLCEGEAAPDGGTIIADAASKEEAIRGAKEWRLPIRRIA